MPTVIELTDSEDDRPKIGFDRKGKGKAKATEPILIDLASTDDEADKPTRIGHLFDGDATPKAGGSKGTVKRARSHESSEDALPDVNDVIDLVRSSPTKSVSGFASFTTPKANAVKKSASAAKSRPRQPLKPSPTSTKNPWVISLASSSDSEEVDGLEADGRGSDGTSSGEERWNRHKAKNREMNRLQREINHMREAQGLTPPKKKPRRFMSKRGERVFSRFADNPRDFLAVPDLPSPSSSALVVHEALARVQQILSHIAKGRATPEWIPKGLQEAVDRLEEVKSLPVEPAFSDVWTLKKRELLSLEALGSIITVLCSPRPAALVNLVVVKRSFQRLVEEWESLPDQRKVQAFKIRVVPAIRAVDEVLEGLGEEAEEEWKWLKGIMDRTCGTSKFDECLDAGRLDELERIYDLLEPLRDSIKSLHQSFTLFVQRHASSLLASLPATPPPSASTILSTLVAAFALPTQIHDLAFKKDVGFGKAMEKGFKEVVNRNEVVKRGGGDGKEMKVGMLLAKRVDSVLRGAAKEGANPEGKKELDGLMSVFKYLDDADFFLTFCSRLQARRLIFSHPASSSGGAMEWETSVVEKLVEVWGDEVAVRKMRGMVKDWQVSEDLNNEFKKLAKSGAAKDEAEAHFLTISSASWPMAPVPFTITVPPCLVPLQQRFLTLYQAKHNGRKLNWLWSFSQVTLKPAYLDRPYVLHANFVQAAILLLFNQGSDSLSFEEIRVGAGVEKEAAKETLELLVKQKVLTHDPEGDGYDLNFGFKYKSLKVPIAAPLKSWSTGTASEGDGGAATGNREEAEMTDQVLKLREVWLEAAVVRVMKAKKTLSFTELVQETVAQVTFDVDVAVLKRQIDKLIDKEYLERDTEERNVFKYIS